MGRSTKTTYELWKLTFMNKKNCPCDIPSLQLIQLQLAQLKHSKLKVIEAQKQN